MSPEECRACLIYLQDKMGMSLRKIADTIGATPATVGNWRRGDPVGRVLGDRLRELTDKTRYLMGRGPMDSAGD